MHQMPPPLTAGQWTTGGWAATFSTPPPPLFNRGGQPMSNLMPVPSTPPINMTQPPPTADCVNGTCTLPPGGGNDEYMRSGGNTGGGQRQTASTTEENSPQSVYLYYVVFKI